METKIVSAIIVSIIVGSAIGFGASYAIFNPTLQSLQTTTQFLQTKTQSLESELSAQNTTQNLVISNITGLQVGLSNTQSGLTSLSSNVGSLQNSLSNTQSSLSNTQSSLISLNSSFLALNSSYTEFSSRQGHLVTTVNTTTNTQSGTFHIQGTIMEIGWAMIGNDPTSYVVIGIYASNGTEVAAVGSSGLFGTFSSGIFVDPGNYYIKTTTYNLYSLSVAIADYY